jgi:hypothetical protein
MVSFLFTYSLSCFAFFIVHTAFAGTVVAAIQSTVTAAESVEIELDCYQHSYCLHHHLGCFQCDPFAGSKLGAEPVSSFSTPSFSCGYQSRACFCTHGSKTFDYHRWG